MLQTIIEAAPIAIFDLDPDGNVHSVWNPAAEKMLGWSAREVMGRPLPAVPVDPGEQFGLFREQIRGGMSLDGVEVRRRRRDGTPIDYGIYTSPLHDARGRVTGNVAVLVDITERKRAEGKKAVLNRISDIFLTVSDEGIFGEVLAVVLEVMKSPYGIFGYMAEDGDLVIPSLTRGIWDECRVSDKSIVFPRDSWGSSLWGRSIREKKAFSSEGPFHTPEGHIAVDRFFSVPIVYGNETIGLISVANSPQSYTEEDRDILQTIADNISPILNARLERDRQEQKRKSLEAQFHHAQKMESIGRLAGGVAHDFNNMLGVIMGRAELALLKMDPSHPLYDELEEIRKVVEHSAELTRQLLTFARKQAVAPRVLDLNRVVEGMHKMLRRMIGEDIHLVWLPGAGLWPVRMDPSQIDQILANLCVNARDAIADVGRVTIETGNITFDEAYCADHSGFVPGDHVFLAVSDDGQGMEKEILDSIFEPFFTTKETGKGTGLGLATVYGVVKQNDGFINVYSEPEHGTIFKIYLPRCAADTEQRRKDGTEASNMPGHETILLVEDDPQALEIGKRMVERLGYRVLTAAAPGEAVRVAREHAHEIDLLITDVIMPEMNGLDLVKNLAPLCPGLKHLFMSGYALHGVLDEGENFIQKPFSMQTLAAKMREVLESE